MLIFDASAVAAANRSSKSFCSGGGGIVGVSTQTFSNSFPIVKRSALTKKRLAGFVFSVKLFGFKPVRWREWHEVLRREHRRASWLALGRQMLSAVLDGTWVSRIEWRRRMRVCHRCPIYGREFHRCRPEDGSDLGCGCSVWLIALFKRTCWADDNCPAEKIGWMTS